MVGKVFALGGSVINRNFSQLDQIGEALEQHGQVAVVTGAGHLKKHQDAVRETSNNAETDMVGIAATRLNAKTLQALIDAYPSIPETLEEVEEAAVSGKNIVMGGLNPGFSTDAVAAVVAELFDAELYIATDVEGIYSEDPDENPEAEMMEEIEVSELLEKVSGHNVPGQYDIVDETAVGIIKRSGLDAKVLEGTVANLEDVEVADGTRIVSD